MRSRRPIDPKLGNDFCKILNSQFEPKEFVDFMNEAISNNVLYKDEKKLCKTMIEQYEVTNNIDIDMAIKCNNFYYPHYRNAEKFQADELIYEYDKFISIRIEDKSLKQGINAYKVAGYGVFSKNNTMKFLNNYASVIAIDKETSLDDFIGSFNNETEDAITTVCEFVDKCYKGGIKGGQVTTILGLPSDVSRSLWSLNIAYNALKQGKNVLYFTLGINESEFNKRIILRHSYDSKFKSELIGDDYDSYDSEEIEVVCKDFYDNLSSRLMVFDESYFDISSIANLQKLIVIADHKFYEASEHGVDLIIIDDFAHMKLNDGKKVVTSRNKIQNEYYSYFRNQCKNFLGTKRMIPILITEAIDKRYSSYFAENDSFGSYMISDIIDSLSDNILVVRIDNETQLKVTIVKPTNNYGMYYLTSINACFENWYMSSNEDDSMKEHANKLFDDGSSAETAIFGLTKDNTEEDKSDTRSDVDDHFGDVGFSTTQVQINQEMTLNKEESIYE